MGLLESAINYFRRLARPGPEVQPGHVDGEEPDKPLRKRTRIRLAARSAHNRVMARLKQPPKHGSNR